MVVVIGRSPGLRLIVNLPAQKAVVSSFYNKHPDVSGLSVQLREQLLILTEFPFNHTIVSQIIVLNQYFVKVVEYEGS